MKKISIALAVASALGASAAHSAIMAEYANALLVPRVQYNQTSGQDTAIAVTTCAAGTVYWAWYNTNSVKQADGQFDMTTNDQRSFTWSEDEFSGFTESLSGQEGYMTFILDTTGDGRLSLQDSTCLSGNAFYIDQLNQGGGTVPDVAFVPTYPMNLAWGDFRTTGTIAGGDFQAAFPLLTPNGVTDIVGLWAGARAWDTIHMRYFVDFVPNSGNDTTIFIWGANPRPNTPISVQQYDDDQNRRSLSITIPGELSVIDVETTSAFSSLAAFQDGFFQWVIDPNVLGESANGIVSWSVATSDAFQATQTLLNPIFRPHIANGDMAYDSAVPERFNIFEYYNPLGASPLDPATAAQDQLGAGGDTPGAIVAP